LTVSLQPADAQDARELGILFRTDLNGVSGFYWMKANGTQVEQVMQFEPIARRHDVELLWPVLSPDTIELAFHYAPFGVYEVFSLNLETDALAQLTPSRDGKIDNIFPIWSPDADNLAYFSAPFFPQAVHVYSLSTKTNLQIADLQDVNDLFSQQPTGTSYFTSLDWSPDGQTIAIAFTIGVDDSITYHNIILVDHDSQNLHSVLPIDLYAKMPS
jgi:Tol biopolymer transport system component